ncbi:cytochrome c family protein [Psychroserpens luteolus]|uniref:cytochrome c family protein n=1 Tax=Psychroserpens luteolus TaxID=2855840 RepID=UPI001E41C82A|nr:cytochrome c family protein [Psychroserpens luteolus]MCD2257730.1 cytochrome c family protein [Psychroserpens luteolus]
MNKCIIYKISIILCVVLCFSSCKHHDEEYHSVTDKIKAESKDYHGTSISSEAYIDHINTIEVTENDITFLIPERKGEIKSYSCTECHSKPLTQMQNEDLKKAHWDIKLSHADKMTMNCVTCHNGNDMDFLQSLTGDQIDFNASHLLCSQCHQKQFNDWTGGAHGKRIESWAPPRASMTCVNCHNPHTPGFESKWPERYNTQKINERK